MCIEDIRRKRKLDVNTFYELRTRLYAVAAAGCGLIAEDFRLKRALEAFQPMSEANKVFGRLYQMCRNLLTTENVAGELAECIALADALAVTQGSFLDKSECVEEENRLCLKPQSISNRYLEEVKNALLEGEINIQHDVQKDVQLMLDPRIFSVFIESLKQETKVIESLEDVLLPQFGDTIIPILKEQIDLQTNSVKNKTAYYIRLIRRLSGYQENDWYLSLIEKEEYPKSIRVAAVYALGCSEKNVPKLLELYKTQKGVVKTAVIFVLAKLDPPEAEEIWRKLTEKYMLPSSFIYDLPDSHEDFVIQSKSDVCAEFAKKAVYEAVEKCQKQYDNTAVNFAVDMIRKKPQLEECFLVLAQNYKYIEKKNAVGYRHRREELNQALIENLLDEDKRYIEMIKNLYEVQKEFYFPARFFLALKEMGESAFEEFQEELYQNRHIMLWMLRNIRYDYVKQEYYLLWYCLVGLSNPEKGYYPELRIFEQIPETVISFVTDTEYFAPKQQEERESKKLTNYQRTYPDKIKDTMKCAIEILERWCREFSGTKEYQKYVDSAVKFAFEVNKYCSIGKEIQDIILPYYTNGTVEKYKGIVTNYSIQCAIAGESFMWGLYVQHMLDKMPMSYEDKKKELLEMKEKLEQFNSISKKTKNEMLSEINRILKNTYAD